MQSILKPIEKEHLKSIHIRVMNLHFLWYLFAFNYFNLQTNFRSSNTNFILCSLIFSLPFVSECQSNGIPLSRFEMALNIDIYPNIQLPSVNSIDTYFLFICWPTPKSMLGHKLTLTFYVHTQVWTLQTFRNQESRIQTPDTRL